MIKLIVFDLDGTLAKLGKGITQEDIYKLNELEEHGITIAICSGKPTYYLCGFMRQVGLKKPVLIGENGAVIQMGVDLPPKDYYIQEYSLAARQSIDLLQHEISNVLPQIWYQPNIVGLTPFPANQDEHKIIQAIIDDRAHELKDIDVYHHCDSFDIVPVGINKNSGLELLGHKLNILPSETVAVGDGENDYPMFDYADFSIGINITSGDKVNMNFPQISDALDYLLAFVRT